MVQLRYFASLRDTLGIGAEEIEMPGSVHDVSSLGRWLMARDDNWATALADQRLQVAINHEIVKPDAAVADGDEVAWFPPVTGG